MNQDFLLELGCEDLPARYVMPLATALGQGIAGGLAKRGVTTDAARVLATPRRIAVLVKGVAAQQPDQQIERLGPAKSAAFKDGQPTPAALGFAKSCGVEFAALGEKDGKLHYAKSAPGKPTADLLPEIFEETLKQMDELVPKRMRWGAGTETFVRPVKWITALLGNTVVPLQRFGLNSGAITYGHRFHAPAAITLKSAGDYEAALKSAKVWADVESRKAEIKQQIETEAKKLGGTARITEDLLDEVTALVEWPVVISGRMEDRFMQLPKEVIIATVETNQRYFTVFDANDRLLPVFITISNIESKDVMQVIAGNERVVRPRLSDALFFWEQDLKQPLAAYGDKLAEIIFQRDLGTVAQKTVRMANLVGAMLPHMPSANVDATLLAARQCKNDLVTRMVYEFPELQGIMGGYYAERGGLSAATAVAIREHYLPTQQGSATPSTVEGQLVALADKLTTLAGIFSIGQKPTASKDPYALRRAANGVLRIVIECRFPLDLENMLRLAMEQSPPKANFEKILSELVEFVFERLRAYYEDLPAEMYEAVKALNVVSPLDFDARVQALRGFWALPAAKNLAAAHKRVRNILKQAGDAGSGAVQPALLAHESEKALATKLAALQKDGAKADYAAKLAALATLREPVDAFFEGVMVNDKDEAVRANRLALLRQLDAACREVADISCLPG